MKTSTMIGLAVLAIGGLWLWSKHKAGAGPVPMQPSMQPSRKAILNNVQTWIPNDPLMTLMISTSGQTSWIFNKDVPAYMDGGWKVV